MPHSLPSVADRTDEAFLGRRLAGTYRICARISRGGAGSVYRAEQERLGREVAVKVLRLDLDPETHAEFQGRFEREAALAARLRHPNVVTVHDYGTTGDGFDFVVMELLEGRTLKEALADGPLPPVEAARIGAAIARGLHHAHRHGLVHRDVKPSNVFLVRGEGGAERPVLIDFGLARWVADDSGITQTGTYLGTPAYMAPEQVRGDPVDHRADVYALGCLLYRMLAGPRPFEGEGSLSTALAHLRRPYPAMELRAPDVAVPAALEAVVRRSMAKEPARRWPDAGAVADALEDTSAAPGPQRRGLAWLAALFGGAFAGGAAVVAAVLVAGLAAWLLLTGGPGEPPPAPEPQPIAPAPVPQPVPLPGPTEPQPIAPAPVPQPVQPVPRPAPQPMVPAPAPAPVDPPTAPVWADGVRFEAEHAARALRFVNEADEQALRDAGVYGRGVGVILGRRPFASLEALAETPWIGEKTVLAVSSATE